MTVRRLNAARLSPVRGRAYPNGIIRRQWARWPKLGGKRTRQSGRRGQKLIDGLAPEHLAPEDTAKVSGSGVQGVFHGGLTRRVGAGIRLQLEACDLAVRYAAGDDPV